MGIHEEIVWALRWAVQLFVLLAVSAGMSELVSVLKRGREAVQTFL